MRTLSRSKAPSRNRRQERADENDSPTHRPVPGAAGRRTHARRGQARPIEGPRPALGVLPASCAGRPRARRREMSSARRPLDDELLSGPAPGWPEFDRGRAGWPSLESGAEKDALLDAGAGDLDLGGAGRGDDLPHPPSLPHRRRAHAASALGAGVAVAVVLVAHSLIQSPSDQRPLGPVARGRVLDTGRTPSEAPAAKFPVRGRGARHRRARPSRVSAVPRRGSLHREPRIAAAGPAENPAAKPPPAEFGFEQ